MNKKLLAKKIFNFKKNKKKITEQLIQLDEFLGMDNLKTDENLGNLQSGLSALSSVSAFIPALRPISLALAASTAGVNALRIGADENSTVPSTSGNLRTQQNMIGLGLSSMAATTRTGAALLQGLPWGIGSALANFARTNATSLNRFGGATVGLGSEWVKKLSDPVSNALGLPPIPGISDYLTRKQGLSREREDELARSPDRLALINAVNATR